MEPNQNAASLREDAAADVQESALEPMGQTLPARRPAELTTFAGALAAAAAEFGLDLSSETVIAIFLVVGLLPGIVSYVVSIYREAIRDL